MPRTLLEEQILHLIAGLKASQKNPLKADDIGLLPIHGPVYAATDSLAENTHYRIDWLAPGDIAYKLFARNWSDFLCKGIRPQAALMNLALRREHAGAGFVKPFLRELDRLLTRHSITLIGGDVTRAGCDLFTLSFFGSKGKFLPRAGNKISAGDEILQLGQVGGSDYARSLFEVNQPLPSKLSKPFRRPVIFETLPDRKRLRAAIDQSDSVGKSLRLLAEQNQLVIEVELSEMPLYPALRQRVAHHPELLISAAEDLAVFAIGSGRKRPATNAAAAFRRIGQVKTIRAKQPGVRYLWHGKPVLRADKEFEHFATNGSI